MDKNDGSASFVNDFEHSYITKPKVCEMLGITQRTLEGWMHRGHVPYYKVGRWVRFREDDSRQVHLFTNETYITAQSVCALLSPLAAFYGPRNVPLTLFLDNARYQRCELVQAHARALGIDLEFLPTYSPNLNLIERDWRWVKKQCLNAKYHPDFATMKNAILQTTALAHHNHAAALASLLTWNFQLFPKTQVIQ